MPTNRPTAEMEAPSASSTMARARLTNPAAALGRRSKASSSSRCSQVREMMQFLVRFTRGPSVFAKTQRQASKVSGL
jgi:hypothetical protein